MALFLLLSWVTVHLLLYMHLDLVMVGVIILKEQVM
jgi:hypothetical protein